MIERRPIKVWRWIKEPTICFPCGSIPMQNNDGIGHYEEVYLNEIEWKEYCDGLLKEYKSLNYKDKYFFRKNNPIIEELLGDDDNE